MPPLLFTSLVGLLFNLLFAGVLPTTAQGWSKLDGVSRISVSAASVNP